MASTSTKQEQPHIHKLNYIGAKARLADWICNIIETSFAAGTTFSVADLFCGSGDITRALRQRGIATVSIDAEPYAQIITHAFARGTYNEHIRATIEQINASLENNTQHEAGIIEREYSRDEHATTGRAFFTSANARRIDRARAHLEQLRAQLSEDDYLFLLASIIVSADKVANIAAVYGAYLKRFKASALVPFCVAPIHTIKTPALADTRIYRQPLQFMDHATVCGVNVMYLDPPYNSRQYSKNYFVLNVIAQGATNITGVTGIPKDCSISPFCRKREVEDAFANLFARISGCDVVRLVLISYNNEGLLPIARIESLAMEQFALRKPTCSILSQTFRRFKSNDTCDDAAGETTEFILKIELHG